MEIINIQTHLINFKNHKMFHLLNDLTNDAIEQLQLIQFKDINKRTKRGLINGLGNIISWITGNMDADDKEYYDKIISNVEKNNYKIEHNIETTVNINHRLIEDYKKDIKTINKNFMINKQNFNSLEQNDKAYDLYIHIMHLFNKIKSLTLSLEFCKMGIVHSNLMTDVIRNLPKNIKLISNNSEVLWTNSRIFCSTHNNIIHTFIKLPIHDESYKGYFILPIPRIINQSVYEIDLESDLYIQHNLNLYTANCIFIDNYYCLNLNKSNSKCVSSILQNGNLANCNLVLSKQNKIRYVDILKQYVTVNITKIVDCKNNSVFLPAVSLINISKNDCFSEFDKFYVHNYNTILQPFYTSLILNTTLVTTHNYTIPPLETLSFVNNNYKYYYFFIIFIVIIIILFMYKRTCNSNIPTQIVTIPSAPAIVNDHNHMLSNLYKTSF